ncbi:MAG: Orotidine 5'-phosphate decarboxylase [Marine Group II euryarchaeote MED-G33]|nr:MAG: Orotidine 5'-phosphate decarboxylase [Marine Group II euryarchaeote MED-G33]
MEPAEVWGARWDSCDNPLSRRYMEVVCRKQSLVVLAADLNTMSGLNNLIDQVGPNIAALKTHVDLIDDWSAESWAAFCEKATAHDLLIFEDRKFADIGPISRGQMAGVYDIRSWANIVTAHGISGPDIVDGLCAGWSDVDREGGVLLLAQMSSRGNLLGLPGYTDEMVSAGISNQGVFGFIGNGSRPAELTILRGKVGDRKLIWTPGVNLAVGDGEMGQRYGDPHEAIQAGSDGIIVGSGIYKSDDPRGVAAKYAEISWLALTERSE